MVCIAAFIILALIGIFVAIVSIFKPKIGKAYLKAMKKAWGQTQDFGIQGAFFDLCPQLRLNANLLWLSSSINQLSLLSLLLHRNGLCK